MTLPLGLHGEVSADGQHLVLIGTGDRHEVLTAAKRLELLTPNFVPTTPAGALACPLSWPAVVQLACEFGPSWAPGPRLLAWIAEQITARMAPLDGPLALDLPAGLEPKEHQIRNALAIEAVGRLIITDEPRTGKTASAVLGLLRRHTRMPVLPAIVVAPAGVVDPWVDHFRTWAPRWRTVAWRGSPKERRALAGTADIYVTSYDTCTRDAPGGHYSARGGQAPLRALGAPAVVIDECHYIKNPHAARSAAVRRLAKTAATVVGLSGTPITHNPPDLWPMLVAVAPGAWPSRERWVNRYTAVIPADYGSGEVLGLARHREPEYRSAVLGQVRRTVRAQVGDWPAKTYSTRTVDLPPEHRKAYDAMAERMIAGMRNEDGEYVEMTVMDVLTQLTRLGQLADSACEVTDVTEDTEDGRTYRQIVTPRLPSWKVDALLEVLAERPGDPTLSYTPNRRLAVMAGEAAEKAGHRVGYIIGGQTMRARTATVDAFQRGELDLLSCTTGAGGTGLTLTAAGTLVFLRRPWSLVESMQSEDRAEGIGSSTARGTEIIDIRARNTVDTKVPAVLRGKAGQLADLLQDPAIVETLFGGTRRAAVPALT